MIARVRAFAEAQRASLSDVQLSLPGGGTIGERWLQLQRVGLYVPGGRAFYPSTLVMTAVPAQVAGVPRLAAVTPPRPNQQLGAHGVDPHVLATAFELGLQEVYAVGGAQGVAFLAHCEPAVDLVAGPGNRFVNEAKRQLIGHCGIDSLAGPTELCVIADDGANPALVAEDMLAQAEHDPDAASVLVSTSSRLARAVAEQLTVRAQASPRRAVVEQRLRTHGRIYIATRDEAVSFAQSWAPEHVELCVKDPTSWLPELTAPGAIFLGAASAEVFGDYGVGPNHVLPTNRTARFSSPLGVASFLKRQSLIRLSADDAAMLAPGVVELALVEDLPHHARSANLRAAATAQGDC